MPAKSEFKTGFWFGAGLLVAFAIISFIQLAFYRAARSAKGSTNG